MSCWLYSSGYADRIQELLQVAKELHLSGDHCTTQNKDTGSHFKEGKVIEFEGVKVRRGWHSIISWVAADRPHVCRTIDALHA